MRSRVVARRRCVVAAVSLAPAPGNAVELLVGELVALLLREPKISSGVWHAKAFAFYIDYLARTVKMARWQSWVENWYLGPGSLSIRQPLDCFQ